jgi:hypothetical protein
LDLTLAGIVSTAKDGHWAIRFENGLFDRGDHFKGDSEALLESLAKRLVQSQEKIAVEIVGNTAGEFGAARARRVEQFLGGLGLFPAGVLRVALEEAPSEAEGPLLRIYRSDGRRRD